MRQRLGVARSLLGDPELLILDEPTNGLDPGGIIEFRDMVRALVGEGRTVVLSSHLLDEVEKICDAIAIVDHGRVVVQGLISDFTAGRRDDSCVGASDPTRATPSPPRTRRSPPPRPRRRAPPDSCRRLADAAAVHDLNRRLVEAGIGVHRIETERISLEDRFLQITSRLGETA